MIDIFIEVLSNFKIRLDLQSVAKTYEHFGGPVPPGVWILLHYQGKLGNFVSDSKSRRLNFVGLNHIEIIREFDNLGQKW